MILLGCASTTNGLDRGSSTASSSLSSWAGAAGKLLEAGTSVGVKDQPNHPLISTEYWHLRRRKRAPPRRLPSNIPHRLNAIRAARSLSRWEFVLSICLRALKRLDRLQGFLTASICFDSVSEEQMPFGEPKRWIARV